MNPAFSATASPRTSFIVAKGLLLLLWAGMVLAADGRGDPAAISGRTWTIVLSACVLGFLMSSAEMLWISLRTTGLEALGKIVQTFAISCGAGILAFLTSWAVTPEPVYWYIAALPAAFFGEKYMRRYQDKQADASFDKKEPQ